MKKANFEVVGNPEAMKHLDNKAIAFIKSRKAEHKIHAMAAEMSEMAKELNVELTDVIVEDMASDDIDRAIIIEFCQTLDKTDAVMVFVSNIFAFTYDSDDLLKFIDTLVNRSVIIIDMRNHHTWVPDFPDDSESDE